MATAADILGVSRNSRILARWSKHYQQLCAERDRLLDRNCSSGEISSVKMDDLGEAASEESQRCLSLVAARATQTSIVDVLEAIRRIERGTYGICELTGKSIPKARLDAIPWTRFTVEAQAQLEREGALRQKRLGALGPVDSAGAVEVEEEDEVEEKPAKEKE